MIPKDGLSPCKKPQIATQKAVFQRVKDGLLQTAVPQHVTEHAARLRLLGYKSFFVKSATRPWYCLSRSA